MRVSHGVLVFARDRVHAVPDGNVESYGVLITTEASGITRPSESDSI
jgi:hypothetical protein